MPSKKDSPKKTDPKKDSPKKTPAKKTPAKKAEDKKPSIESIYKSLEVRFPGKPQIEFISTGSLIFDDCLGGGYARGRIIEMFGDTGTGKSTIMLHGCQSACANGLKVVFIDAEWAMNESLLEGVGMAPYIGKNFFLHKTRTFAEIDELMMAYLEGTNPPDMFVIDSAQAMLPSKKVHGGVEDAEPGLQARYMTNFMQKYKAWVGEANIVLGIINQIRVRFKKLGKGGWDVREGSAGGNALKFFSDVRLQVDRGSPIENPADPSDMGFGNDVRIWTKKSKVGKMRNCILPVLFGVGISNIRSLIYYLTEITGGVTQNMSWYKPQFGKDKGTNIQGKDAFIEWIKTNYDEVTQHLKDEGALS